METRIEYKGQEYWIADQSILKGAKHFPIYKEFGKGESVIGLGENKGDSVDCCVIEEGRENWFSGNLRLRIDPEYSETAFNGLKNGNRKSALGQSIFDYIVQNRKKGEKIGLVAVEKYINQMVSDKPEVFNAFKDYILENGFGEVYFVGKDIPLMPEEREIGSLETRALATVEAAQRKLALKKAKVL